MCSLSLVLTQLYLTPMQENRHQGKKMQTIAVNAKLKCPLLHQIEMSPFELVGLFSDVAS